MITSFLALEPTIQRHGRLSIGLSLKFDFIARQQEGLLTNPTTRLNLKREATTTSPSKEKKASTKPKNLIVSL